MSINPSAPAPVALHPSARRKPQKKPQQPCTTKRATHAPATDTPIPQTQTVLPKRPPAPDDQRPFQGSKIHSQWLTKDKTPRKKRQIIPEPLRHQIAISARLHPLGNGSSLRTAANAIIRYCAPRPDHTTLLCLCDNSFNPSATRFVARRVLRFEGLAYKERLAHSEKP